MCNYREGSAKVLASKIRDWGVGEPRVYTDISAALPNQAVMGLSDMELVNAKVKNITPKKTKTAIINLLTM